MQFINDFKNLYSSTYTQISIKPTTLENHKKTNKNNSLKCSWLYVIALLFITACGTSDDTDITENDNDTPITQEPGAGDGSGPTVPVVIADTNPLPPQKSQAAPDMSAIAISAIETTMNTSGVLTVTWPTTSATSYRVLFWASDGVLHQVVSQTEVAQFSGAIASNGGQLIVESYDASGNSMFSAAVSVEAI